MQIKVFLLRESVAAALLDVLDDPLPAVLCGSQLLVEVVFLPLLGRVLLDHHHVRYVYVTLSHLCTPLLHEDHHNYDHND